MNDNTLVQIRDLSFGYPHSEKLLDQITFGVAQGEVLQVTGPSGSGKTTLLRLIIGELRPDSGSGFLGRQPLFKERASANRSLLRRIGVIYDQDRLLPDRDLFDNVALQLEIKGYSRQRVPARVHQTLHRLGMLGKARHLASQLSASERRLASLACAVVKDPLLIMADLNPGEVDQKIVTEHLQMAAAFGSAVLIFSQTPNGSGREYSLAGHASVLQHAG